MLGQKNMFRCLDPPPNIPVPLSSLKSQCRRGAMPAGSSDLQDMKQTAGEPFSTLNIKEARGPAVRMVSLLTDESSPWGFSVGPSSWSGTTRYLS